LDKTIEIPPPDIDRDASHVEIQTRAATSGPGLVLRKRCRLFTLKRTFSPPPSSVQSREDIGDGREPRYRGGRNSDNCVAGASADNFLAA
jgi:hypothetical protein